MKDIFFSVLIPVYNVENYLVECLNSVLEQTYSNFEIILVNDGSTDSSDTICEKYARIDNRIKYYTKKNTGLLLTRRFSLKKASGEYILFLDSDDYWERNLLEEINFYINKYKTDLVFFRYNRIYENGELIKSDVGVFEHERVFKENDKEVLFKEFLKGSNINNIWSKAVKYEIIDVHEDYTLYKDKKSEDLLQSMPLFYNAHSVLYLDTPLYNYRLSISGRGRNFNPRYFDDIHDVRLVVLQYMKKLRYENDENLNFFYSYYIQNITRLIIQLIISDLTYNEKIDVLKKVKSKELFINSMKYLDTNNFSYHEKLSYSLFLKGNYRILIIYVLKMNTIKSRIKKTWLKIKR